MSSRLGWAAPRLGALLAQPAGDPGTGGEHFSPVGGELVVVLEPEGRQFLLGVLQLAAKFGAGLEGAAALGVGVVALPLRRLRSGDRCLELAAQLLYVALQLVDSGRGVFCCSRRPGEALLEVGYLVPGEVQLLGLISRGGVGGHRSCGATNEKGECQRCGDT